MCIRDRCKHCVALALAFSQRPETFMGYQAQRTAQSSSCITEFMKRTEELQADDTPAESVVLHAELSYLSLIHISIPSTCFDAVP